MLNFEKLENMGFVGCQKLKFEVNNLEDKYPIVHYQNEAPLFFFSGLTGLCLYLSYTNLFSSQINIIPNPPPPNKKKQQQQPECPLTCKSTRYSIHE